MEVYNEEDQHIAEAVGIGTWIETIGQKEGDNRESL